MNEFKRLLNLANAIVAAGGNPEGVLKKIGVEDEKGGDKRLDEALAYAKLLCRLGYSALVIPQDGRYHIFSNVRKPARLLQEGR